MSVKNETLTGKDNNVNKISRQLLISILVSDKLKKIIIIVTPKTCENGYQITTNKKITANNTK